MKGLLPWLRARLAAPSAARWAALIAVLLTAPSLASGLLLDDHVHRIGFDARLRLPGMSASPFEAFTFVPGDAAARAIMMDRAHSPWWSSPDLKMAFFRPLSSLSHWLDHRLFPGSPAIMHAENLLWLAALVIAVGALYRRLVEPAWAAGLATLLFAIDDAHGLPAGWIANRNGLMAATFGACAILAHDRLRRDGWRAGAVVGPLFFTLALLCAEGGVAAGGYLFAHAVFLEKGTWQKRALALVPYAIVALIYRVIEHRLGYGVRGSMLYVDPGESPIRFLGAVVERTPILLAAQLGAPSADFAPLAGPFGIPLAVLTAGLVGFAGWALAPRLRRDPVARFFAAGLVLSALPACATIPNDRLLLLPGIGGMALVAGLLQERADGVAVRRQLGPPARALAAAWVAIHGVIAPLHLPIRALAPRLIARAIERAAEGAPRDEALRGQTLVVASAPDLMVAIYVPVLMASHERPLPAYYRCLGVSVGAVSVTRPDDRTLVLRPEGGYLGTVMEGLVRSEDRPFHVGDRVHLTGLDVEVTGVTGGRPTEVVYRFGVPLEDPSLRWIAWRKKSFEPFSPPPVGGEATIPATSVLDLFL